MKKSALREMTIADLELRLKDNLEALQNLRFQKALQQLENPVELNHLRKEIAQIKTAIKEFELGIRQNNEGATT
ncbi:MAG: 50S ribosomal protein L29 [Candidatus Neomarinimicrobiota bacterium]